MILTKKSQNGYNNNVAQATPWKQRHQLTQQNPRENQNKKNNITLKALKCIR